MSDAGTLGVFDGVVATTRLPPGAPGLYLLRAAPAPSLGPQRMDVAAFVGVAPRGPAYVPVPDPKRPEAWRLCDPALPRRRSVAVAVSGFDDYRRRFGGFEGPGLLPQAVATFFEQGGRRAHIVRIVAPRGAPATEGRATATLTGAFDTGLLLRARDQGRWGDALTAEARFDRAPLRFGGAAGKLELDRPAIAPGTLLQLAFGTARSFAFVTDLTEHRDPEGKATRWRLTLDPAPAAQPDAADVITASLVLRDGAGREERFDGLALDSTHPRWIASVLCAESELAWPDFGWADQRLLPAGPGVELLRSRHDGFTGGKDFWEEITPADFLDATWSPAEEDPGEGIAALARIPDATQLIVPDLYVPACWARATQPAPPDDPSDAGATFGACVTTLRPPAPDAVPADALAGLILDPRRNDDLETIARLQSDLIAFCDATQSLIALVDVPPGLTRGQAERWRARFDTSWCAAYHPWLRAARGALAAGPRPLPPSALAAGIVARKEIAQGLQAGPANEIAAGIVDLVEPVPFALAEAFHPQGLNCFLRDPDGIRLTGARTLSRDPQWRQLSVRRLILMLRRTLLQEMQWAVFEPNGPKLARDLRHAIEGLLRSLFRAGAFAGANEQQAFFVRVLNERVLADRGWIVVEIGVAPVEPLEFIVLRLLRDGDGTLGLEG
ncbi:phage tail sheath family protein [Falsiroseomonas sp. HW251]|uniref:phage tail sheath family protein n=1 Tax=Falsiroseomonas sp. HW251 TaxID=3390998 RepID=UPI003D31C9AF